MTGETSTVYAVLLDWPSNSSVLLGALSSHHVTSVEMLGLTGMIVLCVLSSVVCSIWQALCEALKLCTGVYE